MSGVSRFGLDPEFAIVSKKSGIARSAHTFNYLKKDQRYHFYRDSDKGKTDGILGSEAGRDGPAVEVRSLVHSACRDNIIPYMAEAMRQVSLELEKWNDGKFELSAPARFKLDKTSLKGAPKDVSEFGCNPDVDAYTLLPKSPTLADGDMRRFTGGHIHASSYPGARNNVEQQAALAVLFDYFVALPMVAILGEKFADGEAERREFYGQPGSFRFDNGSDKIEFRTLSGRVMQHPTTLAWAMGMVKSFMTTLPYAGYGVADYKQYLKDKVIQVVSPDVVYDVIMTHNVARAEELAPIIIQSLSNYDASDSKALANPMAGGGGGTTNPYFFDKALEVFVEGNHQGITFSDDIKHNWGLFEDYMPTHHKYWGIQVAMVGSCDDTIFPYNAVLPKVWPNELIQKTHTYTHPLNGGKTKYVKPGAAAWLA